MTDNLLRALYKHKDGQEIATDVNQFGVPRAFLAHVHIPAAVAVAPSTTGIHAAMNLGAETQVITDGFANPAWPRNLRIVGNVAGINNPVKITGTNFADEEIDETLTPNGKTAVEGSKAFKTVTKIDLPEQDHTPVLQVETATVVGTITKAGDALVTVTTNLLTAAEAINVPVALSDNASAIAGKMRTALAANENIAEHFTVSGTNAAIVLTAKVAAANDSTLNIATSNGTGDGGCEGITASNTSANTTSGVPTDTISVGWGDKFGIPYRLYADELVILKLFNKQVEATQGTITADAADIEKNVYDPNAGSDGQKDIDLYIIV